MRVIVTEFVRNEGSVLVFRGILRDEGVITFAADHRPGAELLKAVERGEDPIAHIEGWQVLGKEET